MLIRTWADVLVSSFGNMWDGVIGFLPSFLGALVVFVLGLVVASGLGSLVERLLKMAKLDGALAPIAPYVERAGLKLDSARFFGQVVFWFLFAVFLLATADILRLSGLSEFLRDVLRFVPNIIIAVLVMGAAILVSGFMRKTVEASAASARFSSAKFLGALASWAVIVFGLLTALVQLGIAVALINTLLTGFIAMLALAGGLAFGLGGKDHAARLLDDLRESIEDHRHH